MIAIGISRIAKNNENRIMEPAIITNSSGMATMRGRFEDIRIAQRDFEINISVYYSC
jgi:hypothetical protein